MVSQFDRIPQDFLIIGRYRKLPPHKHQWLILILTLTVIITCGHARGEQGRIFLQFGLGAGQSHHSARIGLAYFDSMYAIFDGESGLAFDGAIGYRFTDLVEGSVGLSGFVTRLSRVEPGRQQAETYRFSFVIGLRPRPRLLLAGGPTFGTLTLKYGLPNNLRLYDQHILIGLQTAVSYEYPINDMYSLSLTGAWIPQKFNGFWSMHFLAGITFRCYTK